MFISRKFRQFIFWAYSFSLLLLSILPINDQDSLTLNNTYVIHIRLDHMLHGIILIPWILLGTWAKNMSRSLALLTGVFMAFLLEGIQFFLPYRNFNINDLIYNLAGTITGCFVFIFLKTNETVES
jgi:VanZ family protein